MNCDVKSIAMVTVHALSSHVDLMSLLELRVEETTPSSGEGLLSCRGFFSFRSLKYVPGYSDVKIRRF